MKQLWLHLNDSEQGCSIRKKPNKHDAAKCITIAIEAVEMQMPLKPRLEARGYVDEKLVVYDTWRCPGCDYDYDVGTEKHNYCPNCGQAVYWGNDGGWEDGPKKYKGEMVI